MRPIHFISGLPRSGSTLLAALLRQNPRFHAAMSGPVADMLDCLLGEMSSGNEYSIFLSDEQRRRILLGVVEQYYGPEYQAELIFDTSRLWCARMALLNSLFPDSRVIACVRELPWIIDSIEQLIRRNAFSPSSMFKFQPGGNVYSRTDSIANGEGMVGFAYNALKEAFYGEYAQKLLIIQYETLVSDPQGVLNAVYTFIGQPGYPHDFENLAYEAKDFDQRAGTPGLHTVRSKVSASPRQTVLPPDVFRRFENDAFWKNPQLNPYGVQIV